MGLYLVWLTLFYFIILKIIPDVSKGKIVIYTLVMFSINLLLAAILPSALKAPSSVFLVISISIIEILLLCVFNFLLLRYYLSISGKRLLRILVLLVLLNSVFIIPFPI